MRFSGWFGVLLGTTILEVCSMNQASVIQIEVAPLRDAYHLGEPIELKLSVRNLSQEEIQLLLDYPANLGLYFSCEDADAIAPAGIQMDRRVPVLRLGGSEEYRRVVALNRYLTLQRPKHYKVDFIAEYMEPVSRENPSPRTFSQKGQLNIVIEPGPIDGKRLDQHVQNLQNPDPVRQQEATEMLIWTDDPAVIAPLVSAAGLVPGSAHDVVRSLERFFPEQGARSGILDIALGGDDNALREALRVFEDGQTQIPMEFYETILASGHTGKVYPTLEHLSKHGGPQHVRLVRPLQKNANPEIQRLASEFVTRMSDQGG